MNNVYKILIDVYTHQSFRSSLGQRLSLLQEIQDHFAAKKTEEHGRKLEEKHLTVLSYVIFFFSRTSKNWENHIEEKAYISVLRELFRVSAIKGYKNLRCFWVLDIGFGVFSELSVPWIPEKKSNPPPGPM